MMPGEVLGVPFPSQSHTALAQMAKEEMGEDDPYLSIDAMFWNGNFVLIFFDKSLLRCAIWLCMYCRNVRDLQHPCFTVVVSDPPFNFIAIAPPTLCECTPASFDKIPCFSHFLVLIACLMCMIISISVTHNH